jgi:hypothetical protein
MKPRISTRFGKLAMIMLILMGAAAVWIPRQQDLQQSRIALANAKVRRGQLEERIAAAASTLESARRELRGQKAGGKELQTALAKAEQELAKVDPESRWVAPPATLPDWNRDSPYLWLRKEMLPKLPVEVFTETGALQEEVGAILTLDPNQRAVLNATLARLLAEYRTLEAAKAERTEDHLPGIAGQAGDKISVRVQPLPEEGARLKRQFETALRTELGVQRADLVIQAGDNWLDSQFSQFGAEPKTISLIHNQGGSYSICFQSGHSWFSTGGPWQIINSHIPVHLRPLFSEMVEPEAGKVIEMSNDQGSMTKEIPIAKPQ